MKKTLLIILLFVFVGSISAQRIKDLTYFKGEKNEQLIGYGLVVGLAGSGDSHRSSFTVQSVISMLKRFNITVPDVNLRTRNVAAVMVTASVSNLKKSGGQFDVVVSSMGDANSLMGGNLLVTPITNSRDGYVYATAQGPISIGGYDVSTSSGGRSARNHSLTGRIPNGAILDTDFPNATFQNTELSLMLDEPDFTTSNNIATAVNTQFAGAAIAEGATEVKITVPADQQNNLVQFMASLEGIQIIKDEIAKVVLNERTGTIVAGNNVRISPVTISHGGLNITISSYPLVSQPNAFSNGQTVVMNDLVPSVSQDGNSAVAIDGATNAQEVAAALNSLKVKPRDMIAIFQALKEAGALTAELIIM